METGIELITKERDEQINKHKWNETDDDYKSGELVEAALFCLDSQFEFLDRWPEGWQDHFKQRIKQKSRIDQLKVAGAFLAAEIDRLQRLGVVPGESDTSVPAPLPTTLEEAIIYLLPRFEGMQKYATKGEGDFAAFCHSQLSGGIGMQIRNELQLWIHESPLHQYFLSEHNLFHPDEMSDLIIRRIYQRLTSQ